MTLSSLAVGVAVAVAPAGPAVAGGNEWTCPAGGHNQNEWAPGGYRTLDDEPIHSRLVELRWHADTRCAWGKISNGSPGDSVWVDWSKTGGSDWKQMSGTRIPSGYRQVYTTAHNDAGYVMRACGKAGNRPEIVCTGWR